MRKTGNNWVDQEMDSLNQEMVSKNKVNDNNMIIKFTILLLFIASSCWLNAQEEEEKKEKIPENLVIIECPYCYEDFKLGVFGETWTCEYPYCGYVNYDYARSCGLCGRPRGSL